jgi:hypothetical protein
MKNIYKYIVIPLKTYMFVIEKNKNETINSN